jgi:hypothetical protein
VAKRCCGGGIQSQQRQHSGMRKGSRFRACSVTARLEAGQAHVASSAHCVGVNNRPRPKGGNQQKKCLVDYVGLAVGDERIPGAESKSKNMKSLVYECDVEWLRPVVEGGSEMSSVKSVKWQKLEDVIDGGLQQPRVNAKSMGQGGTNAVFRMLVANGGAYKGWVEVRKSGMRDDYGVFAVTRFEKGSIVTLKIPDETQLPEFTMPTKHTLHLGWNWVVKKKAKEVGRTINAVYLKENGLIRACTRIMPGTEILLDGEQSSISNGFEWLDSLVFMEPQNCWINWHARKSIGRVVSGDKGRGFVVKYDDGSMKHMMEAKLKELAVSQNIMVEKRVMEMNDRGRENENEEETEVEDAAKNDAEKTGRSMGHIGSGVCVKKKRKGIE